MTSDSTFSIDGFDPLGSIDTSSQAVAAPPSNIAEAAIRGTVANVLKSYTGYYDLFSEIIQNALDALQKRTRTAASGYQAKLWIDIDVRNKFVRVVDNGVGMTLDEFRFCFRPNVSFKRGEGLRGNKGVGATFVAYGFNFVSLQTRGTEGEFSAVLRQGRQWAEDQTSRMPRPTLEAQQFNVPELPNDGFGAAVEVRLTGAGGEKPKQLDWSGASTAKQWFEILRIVSPLGGTYLRTPPFRPLVRVTVTDNSGTRTVEESDQCEYFYPHEIPGLKAASLADIGKAQDAIPGDPRTKMQRLPDQFKRLQCMWDIWSHDQLRTSSSVFDLSHLSEEQRALIQRHKVSVYAVHLDSVRTFKAYNESLGLRKNAHVLEGGLQLASDFMPQGDRIAIPLKRYIGYQQNTHVVVHFVDGSPDLGRKTFQPELRAIAEELSVRVTEAFTRHRSLMRPDTGSDRAIRPDKELHEWKKSQEAWRDANPLALAGVSRSITYFSTPREEQDVIALFHQLLGAQVLRGIRFYGSAVNERYDALIEMDYQAEGRFVWHPDNNPLGVQSELDGYSSEPKVLEYKYDLASLLDDFQNKVKFHSHISLVVCWRVSDEALERITLRPFLVGDEGSGRTFFGATHEAFLTGESAEAAFEVLVLEDLCDYLVDPAGAASRQAVRYGR